MKAARLALLAALLVSFQGLAQQQSPADADAAIGLDATMPTLRLTTDLKSAEDETFAVTKHLRIEGPLVAPMKAKKVWDIPKRILRALNPFAKSREPEQKSEFEGVSSRAWSTTVGWRPGQSAWPDDTHHEAQLRLISIGYENQP